MAIGLAADRLYEELPKETRKALSGLPDTVRGLEADARSLRAQVAEVNGVLAELGDDPAVPGRDAREKVRADVSATRDEAEARMREAVTALETIRVGLLRMHAGESVTMELKAAQGISSGPGGSSRRAPRGGAPARSAASDGHLHHRGRVMLRVCPPTG